MLQNAKINDLINDHSIISAFCQFTIDNKHLSLSFDQEPVDHIIPRIIRYRDALISSGALIGAEHTNKLIFCIKSAAPDENGTRLIQGRLLDEFRSSLSYLQEHLHIEFKMINFLSITKESASLLGDEYSLFGEKVELLFPSIIYEARECAKCLALDRWTASVFHAVRCLEAGIRALCRHLGIADPTKGSDRNWSNIHRSINAVLDRQWPTPQEKMKREYIECDKIRASIMAFQNPYRNETMHLDAIYDESQARHIIEMCKGFIQQIADRCDEQGNPKFLDS